MWVFLLPSLVLGLEIPLQPVLSSLRHQPSAHLRSFQSYNDTYDLSLSNYLNVQSKQLQYSGTLYLGTPLRPFGLIFDTGSAWTWVNDVKCGEKCHAAQFFDRNSSSSYQSAGSVVHLAYGTGSGKAERGWETVALGPDGQGLVQKQGILLMQESRDFTGMQADGILVRPIQGLGFNSLSDGEPTLIDNLKSTKAISSAVFAIYLSDVDLMFQRISPYDSVITMGGWDEKYAQSDFTWVRVFSSIGHWIVRLDSVSLGSSSLSQHFQPAIVDSGTSLLIAPSAQYLGLLKQICEGQTCVSLGFLVGVYCPEGPTEFPDLVFTIDGKEFSLPASAYLKEMGSTCVILIDELQGMELWILGMVFMRAYYTVFDMEKPQIGFALSVNMPEVSSSIGTLLLWTAVCGTGLALGVYFYLIRARKRDTRTEPFLSNP